MFIAVVKSAQLKELNGVCIVSKARIRIAAKRTSSRVKSDTSNQKKQFQTLRRSWHRGKLTGAFPAHPWSVCPDES